MKYGWLMGGPKTFRPRSEDGLLPRRNPPNVSAQLGDSWWRLSAGMIVHPCLALMGSYAASFLHFLHCMHGVASLACTLPCTIDNSSRNARNRSVEWSADEACQHLVWVLVQGHTDVGRQCIRARSHLQNKLVKRRVALSLPITLCRSTQR